MGKKVYESKDIWFITGSQDLYGEETLKQVAQDSMVIVDGLDDSPSIPAKICWKPVVLTTEGILNLMREANSNKNCVGVITWMHTFSPAKMWIQGLTILTKPLLHLHTQFNRDIPWETIDMDFMNLNQSAHGGREYGYIGARLGIRRKIIAGFWREQNIQDEIGAWIRAAVAWDDMQNTRVARFGDNMRDVAVTEGDKVEAQIALGLRIDGYGLGDLVAQIEANGQSEIDRQIDLYKSKYEIDPAILKDDVSMDRIREQAKIELGLRSFLESGNFKAFTTNFQSLHGISQLPGLAVQNLMADGYGFGAEGDWKHSAMVRVLKTMAQGLSGGTSFMEDYTYHMDPENSLVLGAHMLEICPSIGKANKKASIQVHPLGIGGKDDPARLVFDGEGGEAINVSLVDMGNRLRLIVNEVEAMSPPKAMPKLPVARVIWKPKPDFRTGLESWIMAGGAHHTVFSTSLNFEHIQNFATMAGLELIRIGPKTDLDGLNKDLILSDLTAKLK